MKHVIVILSISAVGCPCSLGNELDLPLPELRARPASRAARQEFDMTSAKVVSKLEIENRLRNEKKLVQQGSLKEDNPLDLSDPFRELCEACRRGDLRVCQEKISDGVNINACDPYDYTPLILVGF